jgi:hypothetical protein
MVNKQAATLITTDVFMPTGLCLTSRSIPNNNPSNAAIPNFINNTVSIAIDTTLFYFL